MKSAHFILKRFHIASQFPFFGFFFCGDTARLDNYSFFRHSICWQYSAGPVFLCAKTRVVSVVKAKSMNRSQCLDVYLKLVLGETLWNNGPQDSSILSIIKQCSPDSAPRECFCVLCQALVTHRVTTSHLPLRCCCCSNLNLGHLPHSRTTPLPYSLQARALSPSVGRWNQRGHGHGGKRSRGWAEPEPRRAPSRWRPEAAKGCGEWSGAERDPAGHRTSAAEPPNRARTHPAQG